MVHKKNCQNYFPGTLPQVEFFTRASKTLASNGFNRGNTIVGVCVCWEEPACFLVEEIRKLWNTVFDFRSLAGMPFAGKTGFMMMQNDAPYENGDTRFLYLAFPHIGWTNLGQMELCAPPGPGKSYSGCGGLIAFQQDLGSGLAPWEPDPDNLEQSLLNQQMFRNIKYGGGSDLVTLTKLAHAIILQNIERLVRLTLAKSQTPYAVMTGIQLHGPGQQNFIWPGAMYEVTQGQKTLLSVA